MRKLQILFTLFLLSGGISYALPPNDAAQFEKANIAYREGKFDEASALYDSLATKYPKEAVFHYNLGNALFREDRRGTAILAYERARRHAPRAEDVRVNLKYVRGLLEYRVDDKRPWFVRLGDGFLGYFTDQEMKLFALIFWLLFLGNWAFDLFFNPESNWGRFRKIVLILALVGAALVVVKEIQQSFFSEAIVTTKEAQVYYGPSVNDQSAFRLGDGLKVYVVGKREGWNQILTPSGERGWIQSDQIAEINL